MNILVLDDDVDVLESCRIILEKGGYSVYTFSTSDEALAFLAENPVSLVITDLMMKEIDEGIKFVKEVKKRCGDIPIVMVTGISSRLGYDLSPISDEDKKDFMVDEFVHKPVEPRKLLDIVRNLTRR
ncbi:MAG: response regulator [Candidatus Hydrogenedentes bacterium]|nr:response regulator [Candidatus Hydrogenedentota bacterium]